MSHMKMSTSLEEGSLHSSKYSDNIRNGIYTISRKRGTSKAWEVFGAINDENGDEVKEYVACRLCHAVNKLSGKTTSNLLQHKCVKQLKVEKTEANSTHKELMTKIAARWCIQDNVPLQNINGAGLVTMLENIVSIAQSYDKPIHIDTLLPDVATIAMHINQLRIEHDASMIKHLKLADHYAITTDRWTESFYSKSYISITIHYIVEDRFYQRLLAIEELKFEQLTVEIISNVIVARLFAYEIYDFKNVVFVVSDADRIVKAAVQQYECLDCNFHLINSIVKSAENNTDCIRKVLEKCKNLICYLETLPNLPNHVQKVLTPLSNTTYSMLHFIIVYWIEIQAVLEEHNEIDRLDGIKYNFIEALMHILGKVKTSTDELNRTTGPTLHEVYPQYFDLLEMCDDNNSTIDGESLRAFKQLIKTEMKSNWLSRLKTVHKVALFFHPICKSLKTFSEEEKLEVQKFIIDSSPSVKNADTKSVLEMDDEKFAGSLRKFSRFYFKTENDHETTIYDEIRCYEAEKVPIEEINIMDWWIERQGTYKRLYKVFRKIMCIPATASGRTNRTFAMADYAAAECKNGNRPKLMPDRFDSLFVLRGNVFIENVDNGKDFSLREDSLIDQKKM